MKCLKIGVLLLFIMFFAREAEAKVFNREVLAVRKHAKALVKQKRFGEAIAYYEKMAKKTEDKDHNADFLTAASKIAFDKLEDFDKAMSLAKKIRDPGYSNSRQLVLLETTKKYKEVIERFGNIDIKSWPSSCRLDAFLSRGIAYQKLKNFKSAEQDLIQATENFGAITRRLQACRLLGDLYMNQLKDEEKALKAYRQGLKVTKGNYTWRNHCFLKIIDILLSQGKDEEAILAFKDINFDKLPNDRCKGIFYIAYADVLIKQNNKGQAAIQLIKVLRLGEGSEVQKMKAKGKLDLLTKDMSDPAPTKKTGL